MTITNLKENANKNLNKIILSCLKEKKPKIPNFQKNSKRTVTTSNLMEKSKTHMDIKLVANFMKINLAWGFYITVSTQTLH